MTSVLAEPQLQLTRVVNDHSRNFAILHKSTQVQATGFLIFTI